METDRLRNLPSIDEIARRPDVATLLDSLPRPRVLDAIRSAVDDRRARLLAGEDLTDVDMVPTADEIERRTHEGMRPSLLRVVNATGVVIHTNLGRAPLPEVSFDELGEIATRYSNLEYDLAEGRRGSRYDHITGLLAEVIGAEAVHVVNNNAAALLLASTALARGRRIVVSRGELIEIGGSFRIPDVIRQGGAVLHEVGTTNRTRIEDYESAIGEETAVLMKVHRSNFHMEGFVEEVEIGDLACLARRNGVLAVYDAGSGVLELPGTLAGQPEPLLGRVLDRGADLVTASGDKMLGGPQAGIIAGKREVVEALRRHPLTRALRPCKLTLGLLHHVLTLYRDGRTEEIPAFRMLDVHPNVLRRRASRLARRIRTVCGTEAWSLSVRARRSMVGGGTLPGVELDTWVVALSHAELSSEDVVHALRRARPPVIARIADGEVIVDVRTVRDDEMPLVASALASLASGR